MKTNELFDLHNEYKQALQPAQWVQMSSLTSTMSATELCHFAKFFDMFLKANKHENHRCQFFSPQPSTVISTGRLSLKCELTTFIIHASPFPNFHDLLCISVWLFDRLGHYIKHMKHCKHGHFTWIWHLNLNSLCERPVLKHLPNGIPFPIGTVYTLSEVIILNNDQHQHKKTRRNA